MVQEQTIQMAHPLGGLWWLSEGRQGRGRAECGGECAVAKQRPLRSLGWAGRLRAGERVIAKVQVELINASIGEPLHGDIM
jgi:hypothetical protein